MPDPIVPTRDEFNAAAAQVAQSAPAGLSREDFYGLVDKAISANRNVKAAGSPFDHMGARNVGGYNVDENANQGLSGTIHEMMSPSPGQQLAMDAMPLLGGLSNVGRRAGASVKGTLSGITEGPGLPNAVGRNVPFANQTANIFRNIADRMGLTTPDTAASLTQDINLPPAQASPAAKPPADMWDQALAQARADRQGPAPGPNINKGNTVQAAIQDALNQARQAPPSPTGTTPPPVTQTVAGKPSVSQATYDAMQGRGAKPATAPGPSAPGSNGNGAGRVQPTDAQLDQLVKKFTSTNGQPFAQQPGASAAKAPAQPSLADFQNDMTALRRKYGADRIAQATNPSAPQVAVGQIVKQTGQPSAAPDIAQTALLKNLQDPSTIKNPGNFHRALQQVLADYKRNGAVADSPAARDVAAILKKYGYPVP